MLCKPSDSLVSVQDNIGCKRNACAAESRSTSTGSSRCSYGGKFEVNTLDTSVSQEDLQELPSYEYPSAFTFNHSTSDVVDEHLSPLYIKNTFVEADFGEPSSLNSFHDIRQIQSCPPNLIPPPPGLEDNSNATAEEPVQWSMSTKRVSTALSNNTNLESGDMARSSLGINSSGQGLDALVDALPLYEEVENGLPEYAYPASTRPKQVSMLPQTHDIPAFPALLTANQVQILRLSEALPLPTFGSPELPTIGSMAHYFGNCKPCAHVGKSCRNGAQCPFCHLCPVGELKRRQKAMKVRKAERIQRAI